MQSLCRVHGDLWLKQILSFSFKGFEFFQEMIPHTQNKVQPTSSLQDLCGQFIPGLMHNGHTKVKTTSTISVLFLKFLLHFLFHKFLGFWNSVFQVLLWAIRPNSTLQTNCILQRSNWIEYSFITKHMQEQLGCERTLLYLFTHLFTDFPKETVNGANRKCSIPSIV